MGFVEAIYDPLGMDYSIIGLILIAPSIFLFKQYDRFLDHAQLTFLFWVVLAPTYITFGSYLDDSWVKFIPNFLKFCTNGDFVCQTGFALSWTICLIGTIFLIFLVVSLYKCSKSRTKLQPFYSFFKGFFRWTYIPLAYNSSFYLISDLKASTNTNLIPSIVVLAFVILFPIIQLIVYKTIQSQHDNKWTKWIQFFGYLRQLLIVIALVFGQLIEVNTLIAQYAVYGPLGIYALIHLWKGFFVYKVFERILFVIQQAIIIAIYSFYLFNPTELQKYDIDFIGLSIILFLEFIFIYARVKWFGCGQGEQNKIQPEQSNSALKKENASFEVLQGNYDFRSNNKKNKYDEPDDLIDSRDSLKNTVRRGNQRRRR